MLDIPAFRSHGDIPVRGTRKSLRPLRRTQSLWDESVLEAVRTRNSGNFCGDADCRTCRVCLAHGRALAAAKALKTRSMRQSVAVDVESEKISRSEISAAVDLLVEKRMQSGISGVVKVECVLRNVKRAVELRTNKLLELIATNKLASEAEVRSHWYITQTELEHFLFVGGAHEVTKIQVAGVFATLDLNKSLKLHVTEVLEGLKLMLRECQRRLRGEKQEARVEIKAKAEKQEEREETHEKTPEIMSEQDEEVIQEPYEPSEPVVENEYVIQTPVPLMMLEQENMPRPMFRRQTASLFDDN